MDEIEKILWKNGALIRARDYLLKQSPSDLIAIADLTENIVDLASCHIAATEIPRAPNVTAEDEKLLRQAIEALDEHMSQKASADQIVDKARNVFRLKPWPPKAAITAWREGLKPWPPETTIVEGLKPWPDE